MLRRRPLVGHALDGQCDGVAQCGLAPGQSDGGFFQEGPYRGPVEAQRRLQIGLPAEQDQPHAVAHAALDEIPGHGLDRIEPRLGPSRQTCVADLHASGQVHRQHEVAPGGRGRQPGIQQQRAGRGKQQAQPHQRGKQPVRAEATARSGGRAGPREPLAVGHAQGLPGAAPQGRHEAVRKQRKGQQQPRPGPLEDQSHDDPSPGLLARRIQAATLREKARASSSTRG